MKAIIVGKHDRSWTDKQTGVFNEYYQIHVIYEKSPKDSKFEGQKVEILRVPDGVSFAGIRVGATYDLEFEIRSTKKGNFAYLADMTYVDPADDFSGAA